MHLERKRAYEPEIKENIENKKAKIGKKLPSLPDELILNIFGYLDFKEILNVSLVCRNWKDISEDNHLWHNLYSNYFLKNDPLSSAINFNETFKEICLKERAFAKIFPDWIVNILGIHSIASLPIIEAPLPVIEKDSESLFSLNYYIVVNYFRNILYNLTNESINSPLIILKFNSFNSKIINYAFVIRYYNFSDPCYTQECELIWINENKESLFLTSNLEPNAQLENYFRRMLKGEFCGKLSKINIYSGYQLIESKMEQNFAMLDC